MFIQARHKTVKSRAMEYDPQTALSRLLRHEGDQPLVIGQLGQSLDGRIATPSGASKYINGKEALCHLHRVRAAVDAVIIGVATAIADDPQLTTRHVTGRNPARVIIDPHGKLPRNLRMFHDDVAQTLVITGPGGQAPDGAVHVEIPWAGAPGQIAPDRIVSALAMRGLPRILVEGGAETLGRFLDARAVDELHLMVAPIVLGSGKTGLNLAPITTLDQAMRPIVRMMRFCDGDMLCMCDMKPETVIPV